MNSVGKQRSNKQIIIKDQFEIELLYAANQIVAEALSQLSRSIEPGISTFELDSIAENICLQHKARPAFKGYHGFPASLCASINEEVVHGIPSKKRKLQSGDIISLDFGVCYKGYYGDSAITLPVGDVGTQQLNLLKHTENALLLAIGQACIGNRISDISSTIQVYTEAKGYSVVKQFVGHGIGKSLHEGPEIPNYKQSGISSPRIVEGMVLAIEPMINIGIDQVRILKDGWTVVTVDGLLSAHFEHSVAITKDGPLILSSREKFKS